MTEGNLGLVEEALGLACFIDVETTGLSPYTEEVVEIALCLFEFRRDTGEVTRIVDRYVGLREPGVPISAGAAGVHGIRLKDVKGKRLDEERIQYIVGRAEFLIAHNASFDRGFVKRLFQECDKKRWLCSMNGINWRANGFGSKGLQNLLRDHGITVKRSHRAEDDVLAAVKLLSATGKDGRSYLYELLKRYTSR